MRCTDARQSRCSNNQLTTLLQSTEPQIDCCDSHHVWPPRPRPRGARGVEGTRGSRRDFRSRNIFGGCHIGNPQSQGKGGNTRRGSVQVFCVLWKQIEVKCRQSSNVCKKWVAFRQAEQTRPEGPNSYTYKMQYTAAVVGLWCAASGPMLVEWVIAWVAVSALVFWCMMVEARAPTPWDAFGFLVARWFLRVGAHVDDAPTVPR